MGDRTDTYHHGDLPATLMDLALAHIARDGTEKLSLRALAREAGVSPTAPYRHFPTKRCLLAAIATRGFKELSAILHAIDLDTGDLETAFVQLGLGYVHFAQNHPTTYGIMFAPVIEDFSEYPELAAAAEASYQPVGRLIERIEANHADPEVTVERLGGVAWAIVHGVASLLIYKETRSVMDDTLGPSQSLAALAENPEAALRLTVRGLLPPG